MARIKLNQVDQVAARDLLWEATVVLYVMGLPGGEGWRIVS